MKRIITILLVTVVTSLLISASVHAAGTAIYSYDFENGLGDWYADYGVWETCPTGGNNDTQGVGTVCDGNYPSNTDSHLISPTIRLDEVSGDEEITLEFWHWFSYYDDSSHYDEFGYIQIQSYDDESGEWSDWSSVGNFIAGYSVVWSKCQADLTKYAGQRVRISFYHTASGSHQESGWYIDDIVINRDSPVFSGNFESGWEYWYTDRGIWEIGVPSVGPSEPYEGTKCIGTVLNGNYTSNTDSRLISPVVQLDGVSRDEELYLQFWHWFSYYDDSSHYDEFGYIQIQSYDETTGEWPDEWTTIGNKISGASSVWTKARIDLTAYAGQKVRIGFYHTASGSHQEAGWYIDDIQIGALVAKAGEDQAVIDTVYLDATQSYSKNTTITSYSWTLTHSENSDYDQIASGINPTVSNLEPGFYDVYLTITDSYGNTSLDKCLISAAAATGASCCGDRNDDGIVSIDEVQAVINNFLFGCDR